MYLDHHPSTNQELVIDQTRARIVSVAIYHLPHDFWSSDEYLIHYRSGDFCAH